MIVEQPSEKVTKGSYRASLQVRFIVFARVLRVDTPLPMSDRPIFRPNISPRRGERNALLGYQSGLGPS